MRKKGYVTTTDFKRIMDPARREHFVYRAFDAEGVLLYVGCSYKPEERMRDHRYTRAWFPLAARFRLSGPYNYETARRLEREAIWTERPQFNGDTPEFRAARRAYHAIWERRYDARASGGWSTEAAAADATAHAEAVLPFPSPSERFVSDDTTISAVQRIDALDALSYTEVSA